MSSYDNPYPEDKINVFIDQFNNGNTDSGHQAIKLFNNNKLDMEFSLLPVTFSSLKNKIERIK